MISYDKQSAKTSQVIMGQWSNLCVKRNELFREAGFVCNTSLLAKLLLQNQKAILVFSFMSWQEWSAV